MTNLRLDVRPCQVDGYYDDEDMHGSGEAPDSDEDEDAFSTKATSRVTIYLKTSVADLEMSGPSCAKFQKIEQKSFS